MLIAHELERRVLVPLFDHQKEAPERCCLITTAASRQRPELRAFRDWILSEAALPPPAAPGFPSQALTRGAAFPQRAGPSGASESHGPRLSP